MRTRVVCGPLLVAALVGFCTIAPAAAQNPNLEVKVLHTPSGISFGLLGGKRRTPAPTLFAFSGTMQQARETVAGSRDINPKGGQVLAEHGFVFVVMDLPCHGTDRKPEQPDDALQCWAWHLDRGDDFLTGFTSRLSTILDFLIQDGYSDPRKIAAWGLSRGGFIALHFSAVDPRVQWIVTFAPVTDLVVLHEFKNKLAAKSSALVNSAHKLANRALWMWIGNDDSRVGTSSAVEFVRRVVDAASAKREPANVELRLAPAEAGSNRNGHTIAPYAYEEAAKWLTLQMQTAR